MESKPNQDKVDDLVAMLDRLMEQGGGHINVKVESEDGAVEVETTNSMACSLAQGACAQPTELEIED